MTTRQGPHVIAHTVQIILERPNLRTRIIQVFPPRRLTPGYVPRQIQTVDGENDGRFGLVPEHAVLRRKPFQLDKEDGWKTRDGECLGSAAGLLAPGAVPVRQHKGQSAERQQY